MMRSAPLRLGAALTLGIVLLVAGAEIAYRVGHRLADLPTSPERCAVVVLGYPTRSDGSLHPVQKLRVEAGVAAFRAAGCDRMVVSGAAVGNEYVEAEVMGSFAVDLGIAPDQVVIESRATNTWENVANSWPHLAGFDRIYVASDSLHAFRGRRYFCRQQPASCARVRVVGAYEPLALLWWKVPASLHELAAWIRDLFYD